MTESLETIKKIKVLICVTKGTWGGAQSYVYDLATSLPKEKFNNLIICGAGKDSLASKLQAVGERIITLDSLTYQVNFLKEIITLYKLWKIFRQEKPDILHLNSSKMGLLGSIAGRLAFVPRIIFTVHGWAFNEDRPSWQKFIIRWLQVLTVALCHHSIAVSQTTKEQFPLRNQLYQKIVVIRNGLKKLQTLSRVEAREKMAERLPDGVVQKETPLWIGTIAELHKNKGLNFLIESVNRLKSARPDLVLPNFIIIGEGVERNNLQKLIIKYSLEQNIFLVGQIEKAGAYLPAFDIFILPSITEALPYALLEASQTGLPIIASSVGGIPEIIDDMENGILVKPGQPEELKQAINFLLEHSEKRQNFGLGIKEKVSSQFNFETMVKETIKAYNIG